MPSMWGGMCVLGGQGGLEWRTAAPIETESDAQALKRFVALCLQGCKSLFRIRKRPTHAEQLSCFHATLNRPLLSRELDVGGVEKLGGEVRPISESEAQPLVFLGPDVANSRLVLGRGAARPLAPMKLDVEVIRARDVFDDVLAKAIAPVE